MDLESYHLSGRVDDFHLSENGSTVIGDKDFAFGVLDLYSK